MIWKTAQKAFFILIWFEKGWTWWTYKILTLKFKYSTRRFLIFSSKIFRGLYKIDPKNWTLNLFVNGHYNHFFKFNKDTTEVLKSSKLLISYKYSKLLTQPNNEHNSIRQYIPIKYLKIQSKPVLILHFIFLITLLISIMD